MSLLEFRFIQGGVYLAIALGFTWWLNRRDRRRKPVLAVPAGTLIHINGLPFRLRAEADVYGKAENLRAALSGSVQP